MENRPMPLIRISYDEMEAYLTLPVRDPGDEYTLIEVMGELTKAGVRFGIQQELLLQIVQGQLYDREVLVAQGRQIQNGIDGFYEFYFNDKLDKKPTIREDGSVDYYNIHVIETVEEGQIIAKYTDPVEGKDGMSVKGKLLLAKRGKAQLPLAGKGFAKLEDGHTYAATMSGKIERNANRITIAPVYELFGDAGMTTGNIEFRGDVIIHGNVKPGIRIKATGTVTVDGIAEQCTIEAGHDIILRGGVLGGEKTTLKSKGNIAAKFFEYANVEAEGTIEADSSLNSNLISYDAVHMNGRRASIVGGSVYGVRGIEAYSIGNSSEVKTEVYAGVHKEIQRKLNHLTGVLEEAEELVNKITEGIRQFDALAEQKGIDGRKDSRRIALLRTKIIKQAEIAADKEEFFRLKDIVERGKNAKIRVAGETYAGVYIIIDDYTKFMTDTERAIEFAQRNGSVILVSIKDEI